MGAIDGFRAENPQCVVQVDVGEDLARLEYGEAHIALRAGAKPEHPDYVVTHFRDIGVIEEAISAGLGIGFMGNLEAQKRGNLHPVLPAQAEWKITGWLVTHVDLHHTQKVQAMLASIKAHGL